MIALKVAFAQKGKGFGAVAKRFPAAIARGLNEGGDLVRTQVQQSLWRQTGASKYKSITSRVSTIRAFDGSLGYSIVVKGKPTMKLNEFKVSVTGKGVDAKTWGVDHLFARSFFLSGKGNPYKARLGKARLPIRGLLGPNLAKELSRGDTPKRFILYSRLLVPPAILKHLTKAL